ncbi:MAG: TetR/AcrR family transcriptional regulator [Anaerolineaceae bacterium]|nr:TetR/AcrR family transcriptional regulator [Anaerolineaceae bacterium]
MSRPKKTDQEIQRMREKILDTALHLLEEAGPEAITSRAIAEEMNIAHMSIFTYFNNQAHLLANLRDREMTQWFSNLEEFVQRAQNAPALQVVQEVLDYYISFARQKPNLYRLAWAMPEVAEETVQENRQRTFRNINNLAKILEIGMKRGEFASRDPVVASGVVLGLVNFPNILEMNGKMTDPVMRDKLLAESVNAALVYLLNPTPAKY